MENDFAGLIEGLSAHLNVQLEMRDESTVHVSFDGLPLMMEHLPEAEQLLLAAPVGTVPTVGREEVFRELLKGQYLFAETRGAALALDSEESFICLQIAPSLRTLTRENFPALVENFLQVAETWRQRLEAGPAAPAPSIIGGLERV
jgi:hypothetical protein